MIECDAAPRRTIIRAEVVINAVDVLLIVCCYHHCFGFRPPSAPGLSLMS